MPYPKRLTITIDTFVAMGAVQNAPFNCLIAAHLNRRKEFLGLSIIVMHEMEPNKGGSDDKIARSNSYARLYKMSERLVKEIEFAKLPNKGNVAEYRLEDDAKEAADHFDKTGEWQHGKVVHLTLKE